MLATILTPWSAASNDYALSYRDGRCACSGAPHFGYRVCRNFTADDIQEKYREKAVQDGAAIFEIVLPTNLFIVYTLLYSSKCMIARYECLVSPITY